MSADGGRREEEKGGKKKEKEEQHRGRVVEEDSAGGEGESKDSCADNYTLTFVWKRGVSKDEKSSRNAAGVIDKRLLRSYLVVI